MHVKSFLLVVVSSLCVTNTVISAESVSLQNVSNAITSAHPSLPKATIYTAKEIITLDLNKPKATAVAVVGERILATGTLEELKAAAKNQPYNIDNTFADQVIVPGFIAQHDHPLLTGLTMMSEIIAIEDWVMPSGTIPAAKNHDEYIQRIKSADAKLKDPSELLLTWGYHDSFHGKVTRSDLDKISATRPIVIWHRSAHEFILNTKALNQLGINEAFVTSLKEGERKQTNLKNGRFWEMGAFAIAPKLLPAVASPERIKAGLEFTKQYYHANGITLGSEPGGFYSKQLQTAQNDIFSPSDTPFRYYFIPDGKSIYTMFPDTTITETEKTLSWGQGMTSIMPKKIKLFADGAIYSLAMQMREPYIGDHHGEWIMPPKDFANAFRIYWDSGYQIHIHVTGDAGVDMVLDNVEANMRRNPRYDHRTVLVHFAVSQKDQIQRIKNLGVIVSGNPYYVTMLADQYTKDGLGAQRADNMVRIGDVERANIPYSYHSDMPMAPGQPLFLMDCGVNRTTVSGRVAGADQRATREGALKAVTLEAAYSLGLENEVGSIVPGKLANFTILSDNPVAVPSATIKNIRVLGTVQEGRKLPVKQQAGQKSTFGPIPNSATYEAMKMDADQHASQDHQHSDVCLMNHMIGVALLESKTLEPKQ